MVVGKKGTRLTFNVKGKVGLFQCRLKAHKLNMEKIGSLVLYVGHLKVHKYI